MTPREAFLGPQAAVPAADAAGRIAAEARSTYPPRILNGLLNEEPTPTAVGYIRGTLALGGGVRVASSRRLETIRVGASSR